MEMNKTLLAVLAYGALLVWLIAALWIDGVPKALWIWVRKFDSITRAIFIGAAIMLLVGLYGWLSQDSSTKFGSISPELIGISITVLILQRKVETDVRN
jgi:hypothetical protein